MYPSILNFIFASGIIFLSIFFTVPIVYTFWHDNLRPTIPNTTYGQTMQQAGDLFLASYQILGYVIPIIIIAWGIADAARKGSQYGYIGDQ